VTNYPKPVVIAASIMVGVKSLLAAAAITELIGERATGIILAFILAVDLAVANYVQRPVVPLSHTVAYQDAQDVSRAGGASTATTGQVVRGDATVDELLTP
jgi:hypothetical protein